ncbi:hypothetical protein [Rarobacter incanus]|uniref:hypothetical protein n=1 Tax=Rarobacter incanus TaxID=153494 RepID=UPI00115215C2|nr:hypothetical protein [Rarobacter incanus]
MAVTEFAKQIGAVRDGMRGASAIASPFALWVHLSRAAAFGRGNVRRDAERALGMQVGWSRRHAEWLLEAPHGAFSVEVASWLGRGSCLEGLDDLVDGICGTTADLDRWVAHATGNAQGACLPVPDQNTEVVVAGAMNLRAAWNSPLAQQPDGMLAMRDGVMGVVHTQAAGWVAVAKPFSRSGLDVISVRADPAVATSEVWAATDEVVAMLNSAAIEIDSLGASPVGGPLLLSGHARSVASDPADFDDGLGRGWVALMPRWDLRSKLTPSYRDETDAVLDALASRRCLGGGFIMRIHALRAVYASDSFGGAPDTPRQAAAKPADLPPARPGYASRLSVRLCFTP